MSIGGRVEGLRQAYGHLDGAPLIEAAQREFGDRLAVVSSFGAEAVILLDLVAQVDRTIPIIFLDTDALFDETLAYRDELVANLGLTGVRNIRPEPADLARADELWRTEPDMCCYLRKVAPLERAVREFDALIDGRKQFHGGERERLQTFEAGERAVKISPLANWTQDRIDAAFAERSLPRHPLVAQGYRSIGCWPCTRPTRPGESPRAGRWAGTAKTECGIHTQT